jgi:hypothetical protein
VILRCGGRINVDYEKRSSVRIVGSDTWDRGKELADHRRLTLATNTDVYFCDPQSPWRCGSNENTNGLLRQYFPKGTDLSVYSQAQLNKVARQLNERPRKTLGFATPAERFNACVASTTSAGTRNSDNIRPASSSGACQKGLSLNVRPTVTFAVGDRRGRRRLVVEDHRVFPAASPRDIVVPKAVLIEHLPGAEHLQARQRPMRLSVPTGKNLPLDAFSLSDRRCGSPKLTAVERESENRALVPQMIKSTEFA